MRKGTFMLLRGYIDESIDNKQDIFTLSCLMSTGSEWLWLEQAWKKYFRVLNKKLKKHGRTQITRYHASYCRHCKGEFAGWSVDEQVELTKGLLAILKRSRLNTIAYDTNLKDVCEVFPEARKDRLKAAYVILTKFLISSIAGDQGKHDPDGHIVLFHDRCDYDADILRAFNEMINDPKFKEASYFTSITPLSWEHCIALQPADLVAYEVFKETERRIKTPDRERSKALKAMLDLPAFGISSKTLTRDALYQIKATLFRGYVLDKDDTVEVLHRKRSDKAIKVHRGHNYTYTYGMN
jgi:hypothetical protein